jgi:hypothetical protein
VWGGGLCGGGVCVEVCVCVCGTQISSVVLKS